jgi:TATA-box binding protein (TBP) (component of TFIID and TFIIIB)
MEIHSEKVSVINIPNFDDINVRTRTYKSITNLKVNIDKLFDILPITEYKIEQKKRGRKKKDSVPVENNEVYSGNIISLQKEDKFKGVSLKKVSKKKSKNGTPNYFRNSLTIVMMVKDKFINFKVSNNGKFQMTGCKNDEHAELVIQLFLDHILKIDDPTSYTLPEDGLKCTLVNIMTNIDFNLNISINRENLDKWIYSKTPYHSLLETSFGYTGVNIKIPMDIPEGYLIPVIEYNKNTKEWSKSSINYYEYISSLDKKEQDKEDIKKRYNTFLVFHTGNVIMSGMNYEIMREYYHIFMEIVKSCEKEIKQ